MKVLENTLKTLKIIISAKIKFNIIDLGKKYDEQQVRRKMFEIIFVFNGDLFKISVNLRFANERPTKNSTR